MKALQQLGLCTILLFVTSLTGLCQVNPPPPVPQPPSVPAPPPAPAKEPVNYLVRVQWKDAKGSNTYVQVLTTEGSFNLNTVLPDRVKIGSSDVPQTTTFKGDLRVINPEKGTVNLFLGRTVPYVTSTSG